ncbi:SDR family NAD(P)-dependent oxidoreductase [Aeromicrobium duanguangcaii]|uniref:SDR family NAD(P)-dependent oxidoreductase n=1 Tax=Aeromicrobium duanguangcaii TaxID=2968086 RepID=A0ABY5KBN2_9ACTN|nr:SDR family NAD(P)-dependent oxidoreductase [Aeromicrobium duanguangcaii]MCD9154729.1 SDR family NAD(P)-dependent oxidoreductase [Aeromicrobium duanguangcaii]UUI67857.1 SDR family NAD(P)-dependent oxidoreductase [Aeromicrobium duanguangcaii]
MTRTALITGATAGIGNEFARQLARRGTNLVIVARDTQRLEQVAADLSSSHGVDVEVITADLATSEGTDRVADRLSESGRPIDLLVNNAGASLAGWFGTTAIADEDRQLDLLVRAPMHLMDAAIKSMSGRGRGGIINVASVAAFTPRGAYSAHKAWLVNISQWANWHYADVGITVQALCPGFTRTEFHQRMGAEIDNVPRWMWLRAAAVVKGSLRDLERGRAISVPSLRYKVLTSIARHAPTGVVANIAKRGR